MQVGPARALLLPLAIVGCVGAAPEVIKGDGAFVTVSQPEHTRKSASSEVAQAYCAQQGMKAVFLSDACPQSSCAQRAITYWCH
jgi:hypothetical protein